VLFRSSKGPEQLQAAQAVDVGQGAAAAPASVWCASSALKHCRSRFLTCRRAGPADSGATGRKRSPSAPPRALAGPRPPCRLAITLPIASEATKQWAGGTCSRLHVVLHERLPSSCPAPPVAAISLRLNRQSLGSLRSEQRNVVHRPRAHPGHQGPATGRSSLCSSSHTCAAATAAVQSRRQCR